MGNGTAVEVNDILNLVTLSEAWNVFTCGGLLR
ncbi:hypothetical protein VITU9109_13646 [Vibrio tubiashii ATCC 19109]|uniref:Transposase n=1 Tax=Vibrio tubiashii ATCC 19109 TaxID=1051646 RepID=A0ABP2LKB6_9VIBR|nr:hypothetical protein VITU9109_13646 [Vibrio tubiashii ATCC 19109]